MKPFKKVRGVRVYLIAPDVAATKIHMSDEVKKSVAKASIKDFVRLKVYAVGDGVEDIKEGDEVMVDDRALMNASMMEIEEGVTIMIVNVHDICHVW